MKFKYMKKYFYSLLAAGMLFATSCSQDEQVDIAQGEGQLKTFTVELPGAQSRAIAGNIEVGTGKYADRLICAMYEHGKYNAAKITRFVDESEEDGIFKVTLPMAQKKSYDILFMAYDPDNCAFEINNNNAEANNLRAVQLKLDLEANQEQYDAFVGRLIDQNINSASNTVTLTRPFAQVNVATTLDDLNAVKTLQTEVTKSDFIITNAPNQLDIFDGSVYGSTKIPYASAEILTKNDAAAYPNNEVISVDETDYYYLAMSYVLAGTTYSTHDMKFNFYLTDNKKVSDLVILGVPVRANYRTNIIGTILTQQNNYEVTINPDFIQPDSEVHADNVNVSTFDELKEAVSAATGNSPTIITFKEDIAETDGILITGKNLIIDLNGKTYTVSEGASTNSRNFKIDGSSVVTIKNGTIIAQGEMTSGAYGTVRTEGTANVTLENVKLYSYRGYGLNVKANPGTTITINNSEIYAQYSGGVEAAGGTIHLNNVKIEQNGIYSGAAWCSVGIGVNGGGKVIVNSGNYTASAIQTDTNAAQGTWVAYVMSSGGTLEINGGTFNGTVAETASAANACGIICADRAAVVNINGGTFYSNGAILDMRNNVGTQPNPTATLAGGTFSADPRISGLYSSNLIKVKDGYTVVEDNGTWTVVKENTTE